MIDRRLKIAVIGGGSVQWTFGFLRQFVRSQPLAGAVVSLMDIDEAALELTGAAGQLYNRAHDSPLIIETTTDTDAALDGAEFVIVSISTGGLEAMRHDLEIPARFGIWHTVGDTVGPGGWARAVRNIPVFHDLARRMSRLCPSAWLINVTNPLTVLTRVPHKCYGINTVGMCPGVEETAKALAVLAGASPEDRRDYVVTGIDHGSFFTSLLAGDIDVLAELQRRGYRRGDDRLPTDVCGEDPLAGQVSLRACFALWAELGYMPAIGDRHTVENYPWFLTRPDGRLDFGIRRTSIEDRLEWRRSHRRQLEAYVANPCEETVRDLGHGDDPIGPIIGSLRGARSQLWGSNYRNLGQIPGVPEGAVVETRCLFDAAGIHPLTSPMPDLLKAVVLPTVYRQEAVIDIALGGTFEQLVALVATDPLCARLEIGQCRQMVRELMEAHRDYVMNPRLLDFGSAAPVAKPGAREAAASRRGEKSPIASNPVLNYGGRAVS